MRLTFFHRLVDRARNGYVALTGKINRYAVTTIIVLLAAGLVTWVSYQQLPGLYLPQEDEGYLLINLRMSDGETLPGSQVETEQMFELVR